MHFRIRCDLLDEFGERFIEQSFESISRGPHTEQTSSQACGRLLSDLNPLCSEAPLPILQPNDREDMSLAATP